MKLINFFQYTVIDENKKSILAPDDGSVLSSPYIYITEFELKHVPVAFANTIRRAISTMCPTVTFVDGLEPHRIEVLENTGALHNEFITHRLSLLPINIDNSVSRKHLKMTTHYNPSVGKRTWKFKDNELVPVFELHITNHDSLVPNIHMNNIMDVTTDNIKISLDSEEITGANSKMFLKDPFTKDPILITSLKSKLENSDHIEKLHMKCHPVPNIGKHHTRNDPTGTVEYSFKLDDDRVNSVWEHKLDFLKKERTDRGLGPYTDEEIVSMKKNFLLLDKERVYKMNAMGEANHFNYTVESIGCMSSNQIIYNSIKTLGLYLEDIIESISFKKIKTSKRKSEYKLDKTFSPKISILDLSIENINKGCIIKLNDENHTLGNLLQSKLRSKYLDNEDGDITKFLKIANYKMNHPTIEEIDFVLCIKNSITNELMDKLITKYIKDLEGDAAIINTNNTNRIHYFCLILFIETVKDAIEDVDTLLELFSAKTNIKNPLFEF